VEREKHIPEALNELDALFGPLNVSSVYESEAIGFEGDPFYNLALEFQSDVPAGEIARMLRSIEFAHGRAADCRKFEARTLDIDLVLYGDYVGEDSSLRLPREEAIQVAYMLEPLAEIAPEFIHPVKGLNFARLWEEFDKSQLRQKRVT
jgi:2-amino-4-hydroxy-6-hydroxymethyldihydropteridine diphosphokinase